jgi:flagellar biosynthesis protein FliR
VNGAALDAWIAALPAQALVFALVLCRVSAAVMLMPGLGEQTYPMTVRAGIALCLTGLVMPLVQPAFGALDPAAIDPWRLGGMVVVELLTGGLIGWLAQLVVQALPVAGQVISLMTGLSNVLQPDPALGSEIAAPSRLFGLLAPVLVLVSGAWILPVRAVIGSYALVPAGSAILSVHAPLIGDGVQAVVRLTGRSFALALELSAPFVLLSVVWEISLGVLGRLVPNLQVYNLASPLQMLGGIGMLALLMRAMLETWPGRVFDLLSGLPGL